MSSSRFPLHVPSSKGNRSLEASYLTPFRNCEVSASTSFIEQARVPAASLHRVLRCLRIYDIEIEVGAGIGFVDESEVPPLSDVVFELVLQHQVDKVLPSVSDLLRDELRVRVRLVGRINGYRQVGRQFAAPLLYHSI